MPTIRVSDKNYAYLLGVAAAQQMKSKTPQTPNDALDWVIETAKKYVEEKREA